jgi:erythromycin esterase-like protein
MALVFMILGFIWWWPLGLLILGILIASGRIGCWHRPSYAGGGPMGCLGNRTSRWDDKLSRMQEKVDRVRSKMDRARSSNWWGGGPASSGNRAFDDYRSETLKRLEEEQREFREFLDRLRFAKDKTEFDQFMAERRDRSPEPGSPQPQA